MTRGIELKKIICRIHWNLIKKGWLLGNKRTRPFWDKDHDFGKSKFQESVKMYLKKLANFRKIDLSRVETIMNGFYAQKCIYWGLPDQSSSSMVLF